MNDISFAGKITGGEERRGASFCIVASNSGKVLYGDKSTPLKRGEITVIPPFVRHTVICGGDVSLVTVEKALLPIKTVTSVSDENEAIRSAMEQAIYFFNSDNPKRETVLAALGDLISAYISAFSETSLSPAVALVKRDIENNLSDSLYALDAYIKSLPLNYDYVRKLFKKEMGVTPHEYLIASRMKIAASILSGGAANTYTNYSVSQVAEVCGFSEPLYFSRVFKKYYGVSPTDYAKMLKLS